MLHLILFPVRIIAIIICIFSVINIICSVILDKKQSENSGYYIILGWISFNSLSLIIFIFAIILTLDLFNSDSYIYYLMIFLLIILFTFFDFKMTNLLLKIFSSMKINEVLNGNYQSEITRTELLREFSYESSTPPADLIRKMSNISQKN